MRERLPMLFVMAIVAMFVVAGCGDEGDDASAGDGSAQNGALSGNSDTDTDDGDSGTAGDAAEAESISKKAFIKQGNTICESTVGRIAAQSTPAFKELERDNDGSSPRAVEMEVISTVVLPELRREVEELESLGSPVGDEVKVARITTAIGDVIEEAEDDLAAAAAASNQFIEESSNLAASYGLDKCPYG